MERREKGGVSTPRRFQDDVKFTALASI